MKLKMVLSQRNGNVLVFYAIGVFCDLLLSLHENEDRFANISLIDSEELQNLSNLFYILVIDGYAFE